MKRFSIVLLFLFMFCSVAHGSIFQIDKPELQGFETPFTVEEKTAYSQLQNQLFAEKKKSFFEWEKTISALQGKLDSIMAYGESGDWQNALLEVEGLNAIFSKLSEYAQSEAGIYQVDNFNDQFSPQALRSAVEYMDELKALQAENITDLLSKAFSSEDERTRRQGLTFINSHMSNVKYSAIDMIQYATDTAFSKQFSSEYFKATHDGKTEDEVAEEYLVAHGKKEGTYFSGMYARIINNLQAAMIFIVIGCMFSVFLHIKNWFVVGMLRGCIATALGSFSSFIILAFMPFMSGYIVIGLCALLSVFFYHQKNPIWRVLPKDFREYFLSSPVNQEETKTTASDIGEGLHGSASWGSKDDMALKGHISIKAQDDFAIARIPLSSEIFRYMGHLVVCAPTGSGKGIGSVIPNLLEYKGSSLVLDLKGENYAVTQRQRKALGHSVYCIDPFDVSKSGGSAYNPLDRINLSDPDCVGVSLEIAKSLVMRSSKETDGHWNDSAENLLQGLILFVKTFPDTTRHTLAEVRRLITLPLKADRKELAKLDDASVTFADVESYMQAAGDIGFGIIARAGNAIASKPEKEKGSIISTAQRHTAFLDDPRIASALSSSALPLERIKEEKMTVFVILPPARLEQNARFVRLVVDGALSAVTSTSTMPAHRVAFFLDEFAQLGYMEKIEKGISLLRGYGASFIVYLQDLSQLKGVYSKWQSFLANSCKVFYGTADFDTAKYISDSLGKQTLEYYTQGESANASMINPMQRGSGTSESQQFTGRNLLDPDEVMRLGAEKPVVLISGERPYQLERLNYLKDVEYQGLFDDNPYHS